jgi:hypothetical protein
MAVNKSGIYANSLPQLRQTISSSGTYTVPAGINYIYIMAAGGGGSGGGGTNPGSPYAGPTPGNSGGGGGGVAQGWVPVTPGDVLNVVVAAAGGTSTVNAASGAITKFRFTANAGGNGADSSSPTTGNGGTASALVPLSFSAGPAATFPLPTTVIGTAIGAPNYSGSGSGAGLTGAGIAQSGFAGFPNSNGGAGILAVANDATGGAGGGGGGAPSVGGGAGGVLIFY